MPESGVGRVSCAALARAFLNIALKFSKMVISDDPLECFMLTVSVAEAKAQFSALLDAVQAGEEIVITRRGQAVARLRAEPPAEPDFSVFRRLRGAWKEGMRIDRDALHERD